jgi:glycosyltransferase involved in cell wall biosynthesis
MNNDLVSVVLCTYNGIKFIESQLSSIQKQTHNNLEIIIFDDVSTDGTFEFLEQRSSADSRIQLYRNENNIGYNINFSRACMKTKGDYIAIADQDDVWEENKIAVLLAALLEDDGCMLAHGISARFEEEGKPHLKSIRLVNFFIGNDARQFLLQNIISGHNMLFRKKILESALPFPSTVYYDWWLVMHICSTGKIIFVNEILTWHRMHGNNATGGAKPKTIFYKQTLNNLSYFLQIKSLPESFYQMATTLQHYYQELNNKSFSLKLFLFIFKNAPVLLAYKKKTISLPSYLKHAIRYSKNTTLA